MTNRDAKKSIPGFKFAGKGIVHLFRSQVNARIHAIIAIAVIMMGWFLDISTFEWYVVIICIGLVLAAEMFNTAIEQLTDLVSPEFNKKAGLVKDLSAGAVLLTAIASAIAGIWIFAPKVYAIACTWFGNC